MEMGWWSPMRSVFFSGVTPMNGGMGLNWRPHGCPPVDRWISLKDKWRTWKHWTSPWTYGCFMMSCNFLIKLKPSRWYYMCPFWNWDGFPHSAELMICRAGKEVCVLFHLLLSLEILRTAFQYILAIHKKSRESSWTSIQVKKWHHCSFFWGNMVPSGVTCFWLHNADGVTDTHTHTGPMSWKKPRQLLRGIVTDVGDRN